MKIAFDVSDLCTNRADGTTRYTKTLWRRWSLLARQHDWHLFAPCRLSELGAVLHASPWPKCWTQLRLPVDLYRYRCEVLFMPIQQLPVLRPRYKKTVAVVHDLAFHYYPDHFTYKDWALLHLFTAQVAREADELIAVSKATASDLEQFYGRREKVTVIYHGVDQGVRNHEFKVRGDSKPYILFVGQIQPRKNIVRLVEAFEQLAEDEPDLQLVIAGGHGWLQAPILEAIRTSRFSARIRRLGRVSDEQLAVLYAQAEVFVLPSLYEGFGLPVLEAMAAGCPVVTSNVSSLPEVVGDAAVLVDPHSSEAMALGIQSARARRAELSAAGRHRAALFSWDKTAQQTLAVLES